MSTEILKNKIKNYKAKSKIYSGHYKFENDQQALNIIEKYHDDINDDGTLTMGEWSGEQNQELIAALNYYKFKIKNL